MRDTDNEPSYVDFLLGRREPTLDNKTMSDLKERADRVRAIVEANHGKVIDRTGDIVTVEVPADVAPGMWAIWGMARFNPIFDSQDTRLAPRRITNMHGHTIVCDNDMVTTAFYRYTVDLRPRG